MAAAGGGGGGAPPSWVCGGCTYENAGPLAACEACDLPNPATHYTCVCTLLLPISATVCSLCGTANPLGGWTCDKCTLINDTQHPACVACGEHNPAAPAHLFAQEEEEEEEQQQEEQEEEEDGSDGGGGGGAASHPSQGGYDFGARTPLLFASLEGSGARSPGALARLVDPVLAPLDIELLGAVGADPLTASVVFQRQLGWSSIRHARYAPPPALVASYCSAMEDAACELCPDLAAKNECLTRGMTGGSGGSSAAAAAAIAKEIAMLKANTSNSCWPSSIMVRADEANLCALKAAITGPDSTPYVSGGGGGGRGGLRGWWVGGV
jgi:hypothetical protein